VLLCKLPQQKIKKASKTTIFDVKFTLDFYIFTSVFLTFFLSFSTKKHAAVHRKLFFC
jgi:hypothetical protein